MVDAACLDIHALRPTCPGPDAFPERYGQTWLYWEVIN